MSVCGSQTSFEQQSFMSLHYRFCVKKACSWCVTVLRPRGGGLLLYYNLCFKFDLPIKKKSCVALANVFWEKLSISYALAPLISYPQGDTFRWTANNSSSWVHLIELLLVYSLLDEKCTTKKWSSYNILQSLTNFVTHKTDVNALAIEGNLKLLSPVRVQP